MIYSTNIYQYIQLFIVGKIEFSHQVMVSGRSDNQVCCRNCHIFEQLFEWRGHFFPTFSEGLVSLYALELLRLASRAWQPHPS